MQPHLSDEQWAQFNVQGYLRLGSLLSTDELTALQRRIDDIMLGKADVPYNEMMMQLDSTSGEYGDAGEQTTGHKGVTLNYRKIEQLERDSFFLNYLRHPVFKECCDRLYGQHVPVGVFRSMFMNKPAGLGTKLPWHQDRWTHFDRDPLITVWTALDPATKENGCVQILPGTHRFGVINTEHSSGFLTSEQAEQACAEVDVEFCELLPGECVLLHNWLLHSSDKNHSDQSRRAFSVCYADARTNILQGDDAGRPSGAIPVVFGKGAL